MLKESINPILLCQIHIFALDNLQMLSKCNCCQQVPEISTRISFENSQHKININLQTKTKIINIYTLDISN